MAQSVGGFFAAISLKPDQASFDATEKNLKNIESQFMKTGRGIISFAGDIVKSLVTIGGAAIGAAYSVSQIQGKMAVSATGAGMKFEEYNKWAVALGLIGGNIDDLSSKLTSFEDTLSGLSIGRKGEEYTRLAKDLAIFGQIDINKFKALSQTGRLELVSNAITNQSNPEKRQAMEFAAGEMFGQSFLRMVQTFRTPGSNYTNVGQLLGQAGASSSAQSGSAGLANMQSFDRALTDISQSFKMLGEMLGTQFRPVLDGLSKWIEANQSSIRKFFDDIGKLLSALVTTLGPIVSNLAGALGYVVDKTANGPSNAMALASAKGGTIGEKLASLKAGTPWFGSGSILANDDQIIRATNDLKAKGAAITAGITSGDVASAGLPSSVQIGSITVNASDSDLKLAVAQLKAGNVPAMNSKEAAVQIAVMAGMLAK